MNGTDEAMGDRDAGVDTDVNGSFVGALRARDVDLHESAAGFVAAGGNLTIHNGGCGPVFTKGSVTIHNGGCGPMIVGGDVSIEYGGTQSMLAGGKVTIGQRGFVGVVASPSVVVEEGGRVLLGTREALALGAAAGAVWALVSLSLRRRGR